MVSEHVGVGEAARTLGVSKRAVRNMAADGKLEVKREGATARLVVSVAPGLRRRCRGRERRVRPLVDERLSSNKPGRGDTCIRIGWLERKRVATND